MKKLVCLLLITAMLLSGCASQVSVSPEKTEEPAPLTDITVVLDWAPNTNHTGLYVAQANGYYEEAGLNVEIVQPPEDGATSLVAAGKAQFGVDFQDYLAPAFALEDPIPVTAVATFLQHNTSGIISLKETGIASPADLAGHNYATWDLPVEKAMIARCMENEGANFSDLELIPSTVTDVVTALETKMVDSVWVYYGWDGIATELAGLETNYFAFSDIEPAFDYYTPVLVANNDFLATSPEVAKAFLSATAKGYEFACENPEDAGKILCEAAPELDLELVTASQTWLADQYIADGNPWGYMDGARWDGFYDYLWAEGLMESEIPDGFGFTNDYLAQ